MTPYIARSAPIVAAIVSAASATMHAPAAQAQAAPGEQSPIGIWEGALQVGPGMQLRLVFHIEAGDDAALAGRLDSPDQGARGIPLANVRFDPPELRLEVPSVQGSYSGTLVPGDSIVGQWTQAANSLPLILHRSQGVPPPERPQLPREPVPYAAEDVRFPSDAAGIELAGTLTIPAGDGPFPAVALVSGSGPQDRDHTIFGHATFLVLADHLTRAGIAVLRYDDRGVGASEGNFQTATSFDFAADAAAAARFLAQHHAVDPARVGLVGLSEGALIAPLVATGFDGAPRAELAFVVLLAPPAMPGDEILYVQADAILGAMGVGPDLRAMNRTFQERLFEIVRGEPDIERRREAIREMMRTTLDTMPAAARAMQGIAEGREDAAIETQLASMGTDWFRSFVMHDPRNALRELRIPTLALFGELDLQVLPAQNRPELEAALRAAGNDDVTVHVLPGLNHLFQTANTGAPAEYATITETVAPVALDTIRDWILARF